MYVRVTIGRVNYHKEAYHVKGLWDSIFLNLYTILYLSIDEDPDLKLNAAASDMGLHCLPMSHTKPLGYVK